MAYIRGTANNSGMRTVADCRESVRVSSWKRFVLGSSRIPGNIFNLTLLRQTASSSFFVIRSGFGGGSRLDPIDAKGPRSSRVRNVLEPMVYC